MTGFPTGLGVVALLLAMPSGDVVRARAAVADPAVPADAVTRWRRYTIEASRRFGVPLDWIERVMRAESGGHTHMNGRPTTSRAGAMGLMQIMPATWSELRVRLALGTDPHDPRDNILAGTFYLRLMHERFGYPGLFGAYNAGPARYAAWLSGRRALPAETRAYLAQLGQKPNMAEPSAPIPERGALFAIQRRDATDADTTRAPTGLFVTLSTSAAAPGLDE